MLLHSYLVEAATRYLVEVSTRYAELARPCWGRDVICWLVACWPCRPADARRNSPGLGAARRSVFSITAALAKRAIRFPAARTSSGIEAKDALGQCHPSTCGAGARRPQPRVRDDPIRRKAARVTGNPVGSPDVGDRFARVIISASVASGGHRFGQALLEAVRAPHAHRKLSSTAKVFGRLAD